MKELERGRKNKGKQRSQVEGVFRVGKRKYDLDLVKIITKQTSEVWIGLVYLVMNIAHFMRVIFWPFLKKLYFGLKKLQEIIFLEIMQVRTTKFKLNMLIF